jgi:hypothetical protein
MIRRALVVALVAAWPTHALAAPVVGPPGIGRVLDEGVEVGPGLGGLNLVGAGVTCVANAGQDRRDCTITSGGGGGASNVSVNGGSTLGGADLDTSSDIAFAESSGNITATIVANAIVTGDILNGTVLGEDLANGTITGAKIGTGEVGPTQLASTAVGAGSYGSATSIPSLTVDADGRLTAAAGNALVVTNVGILAGTFFTATGIAQQGAANDFLWLQKINRNALADCATATSPSRGDICQQLGTERMYYYTDATDGWVPFKGHAARAEAAINALDPVYVVREGPSGSENRGRLAKAQAGDETWVGKSAIGIALASATTDNLVLFGQSGFVLTGLDTDETGSAAGAPICVGNTGGLVYGKAACDATYTKQTVAYVMNVDASAGRILISIENQAPGRLLVHATDCTGMTGIQDDICHERDDDTDYRCGTATCSAAGWVQIGGLRLDGTVLRPKVTSHGIVVGTQADPADADHQLRPGQPAKFNLGFEVGDRQAATPGNRLRIFDNDNGAATVGCSECPAGELCITDADNTSTDDWRICSGTTSLVKLGEVSSIGSGSAAPNGSVTCASTGWCLYFQDTASSKDALWISFVLGDSGWLEIPLGTQYGIETFHITDFDTTTDDGRCAAVTPGSPPLSCDAVGSTGTSNLFTHGHLIPRTPAVAKRIQCRIVTLTGIGSGDSLSLGIYQRNGTQNSILLTGVTIPDTAIAGQEFGADLTSLLSLTGGTVSVRITATDPNASITDFDAVCVVPVAF